MRKSIPVLLLCFIAWYSQGQDDPQVSLDILRGPASPAANLLGISNSQIEKPSDPTSFTATINQASGGFSTLPTSFAVDLAPAWLFRGKHIKIENYLSDRIKYSVPQSFVFSFATKSVDSLGNVTSEDVSITKFAAGMKLSILRGDVDKEMLRKLETMRKVRRKLTVEFTNAKDSVLRADSTFQMLQDSLFARKNRLEDAGKSPAEIANDSLVRAMNAALKQRQNEVMIQVKEMLSEDFAMARAAAEDFKFTRYGFKLDLAGAIAYDFPRQNFNDGKYVRSGLWLTGGWEYKNGLSALFIARYQFSPDQVFADESILKTDDIGTFDGGARFVYSNTSSPFACSAEAIYRSVLHSDTVEPSWRVAVNAEYDIGKNKKLTFTFGRDFDGTITKDGNLIAALNLLMGFGSKKSF